MKVEKALPYQVRRHSSSWYRANRNEPATVMALIR